MAIESTLKDIRQLLNKLTHSLCDSMIESFNTRQRHSDIPLIQDPKYTYIYIALFSALYIYTYI